MIRRHRAANIAAASGDECIILLNELVLVYVADGFLMEDAEERWTCRWKFSVFLRSFFHICIHVTGRAPEPPPSFLLIVTRRSLFQ